jgi:microcystin-dependent protein
MGYDPFIGEISIWPINFAPNGYAFCNGQLMSISQNTALFSLLGTYFGGNGTTTFALPDLRGRVVIGAGAGPGLMNYDFAQVGGQELNTFNVTQLAPGVVDVANPPVQVVTPPPNSVISNVQPYVSMNYIIAIYGIYPSRW